MWTRLLGLCLMTALFAPPVFAQEVQYLDQFLQNAATADGNGSSIPVDLFSSVALDITITGTATVNFEGSVQGATATAITCTSTADATAYQSVTASALVQCNVAGFKAVRARISGCAACTVTVYARATSAILGRSGAGGGVTGWPTSSSTKEITWANSLANAAKFGTSSTDCVALFSEGALGPQVRPCVDSNTKTLVLANFNWSLYDVESSADILTVDPDAASKNAIYQFGANYKPILSIMVPLIPRGAAFEGAESIVTNQPKANYLTVTDVDTDAADFSFTVTSKMVGATTATFRLIGVSKNAAPSGNIELDCAMSEYTPGTNTFAAHVTTGEVAALLTPATQSRPVAVTTAAHTINGTLAAGDIVFGSCEVDATATTSAQMTDFRLYGYVLVQLSVNSLSD